MNWISALNSWQWALMLLIPPAVLSLYFLKLKRRELEVPSTLLWKRALEDIHVNSIWQRLRKNLLLYLQLLFLALAILACLRPGWSGQNRIGERRIYIIDNSASMQATDVDPSRLEMAKRKTRELLEATSNDDVGMVIAFSDRADVRQGFTSDRNRLLSAVDSIQATAHATDVSEALRAAAGLANPGRSSFDAMNDIMVADAIPATVYLLSDGAFGDLGDIDLGKLKVEYIPIGEPKSGNLGIVGFAVQRNEDKAGKLEAFARLVNNSNDKVEFGASLELDGKLLDASTGSIEAKQESGILFELENLEQGLLKLQLDYPDSLTVDNVAYAAVRPARPIGVLLVTSGNTALETALQTARVQQIATLRVEPPSFLEHADYAKAIDSSSFDLIVFDQCSPKQMPASNTLFLGSLPPLPQSKSTTETASTETESTATESTATGKSGTGKSGTGTSENVPANDQWQFGKLQGPTVVLDVNRGNTMTQYLEMGAVSIVEARTVTPPEAGSILMTGDIGPLFAIAPRGPFQDAVLGFSMVVATTEGNAVNTDWGIRRSFPVFVYSAVEFLGGGVTESSAPTVLPGWPIGLQLSNRFKNFQVVSPSGEKTDVERGEESRYVFTKTDTPGAYQVLAEGFDRPVETFCVNLFSSRESNLDVTDSIKMGYDKIGASDTKVKARQEVWRWILLAGLLLLVLEWVIFNRRVFV
ncbi:MAG: BatA and WFA domain-containing protein [Pirellula sp.]